ncbi:phospholipase [bacterium]|nr:phospholipase [bacterium]
MKSSLHLLSIDDLRGLASAFRSGRLVPPLSRLTLRRYVPDSLADDLAIELQRHFDEGMQPGHVASLVEILAENLAHRPKVDDLIDLVWTGPEARGFASRDTAVVVRELFQNARQSVMVVGYAVHRGHLVFKSLAERMDLLPHLRVSMFLDVRRPHGDQGSDAEIVRRFGEHFATQDWPGARLPSVYYDSRSLAVESSLRASLHAKCVVVDREVAFVSSANFTEAAQLKNIEVGVVIRSGHFARQLSQHFEALAAEGYLKSVPLGIATDRKP